MSENARMLAFTEKVNLPLFGDATRFILNAAEASCEPQLLWLLGKGRTIPPIGNLLLFAWLVRQVNPLMKTMRTKDAALFRALCLLQRSFARPGSHQLGGARPGQI